MSSSLILHKRITTTVAKAKALRKFVEPLLTKAKNDTTHSRRTVFSTLQNKESLKELFGEIAGKIADRPGGYTRIIKLSATRLGDNSEMCIIELVDYNDTLLEAKNTGEAKSTTRRSRRSGKKTVESKAESLSGDIGEAIAPNAMVETSAPEDTPTITVHDGESREDAQERDAEEAS